MSSNGPGISSHVVTPNAIATGLQPSGADSARLAAASSFPESPSRPVAASEAMPPLLTEELLVESTQFVPKLQRQGPNRQAGNEHPCCGELARPTDKPPLANMRGIQGRFFTGVCTRENVLIGQPDIDRVLSHEDT